MAVVLTLKVEMASRPLIVRPLFSTPRTTPPIVAQHPLSILDAQQILVPSLSQISLGSLALDAVAAPSTEPAAGPTLSARDDDLVVAMTLDRMGGLSIAEMVGFGAASSRSSWYRASPGTSTSASTPSHPSSPSPIGQAPRSSTTAAPANPSTCTTRRPDRGRSEVGIAAMPMNLEAEQHAYKLKRVVEGAAQIKTAHQPAVLPSLGVGTRRQLAALIAGSAHLRRLEADRPRMPPHVGEFVLGPKPGMHVLGPKPGMHVHREQAVFRASAYFPGADSTGLAVAVNA